MTTVWCFPVVRNTFGRLGTVSYTHLCFIYQGHELKITELLTGQSLAVPGTAGNFYALNLEAVRLKFFTDYGVLANLFDVYSGCLLYTSYKVSIILHKKELNTPDVLFREK